MFKLQEELDSIEKEIKLNNTPQDIKDAFNHSEKTPSAQIREEWRTVKGFEDYEISSFGRLKNSRSRVTKGSVSAGGYMTTNLRKDGESHFKYFHVLVAEAFLGYVANKGVIVADHIDADKTNNKLSNLQVISHRENLTKDRDNKTGFTGVHKMSDGGYVATIVYEGKLRYLGYSKVAEEAGKIYESFLKTI